MKKKRAFMRQTRDAKHVGIRKRDAVVAELVAEVLAGKSWVIQRCGDYEIHVSRDEMGSIEVHDCVPFRFGYFHPSCEYVRENAVHDGQPRRETA